MTPEFIIYQRERKALCLWLRQPRDRRKVKRARRLAREARVMRYDNLQEVIRGFSIAAQKAGRVMRDVVQAFASVR